MGDNGDSEKVEEIVIDLGGEDPITIGDENDILIWELLMDEGLMADLFL
jgi:hypothetical protein